MLKHNIKNGLSKWSVVYLQADIHQLVQFRAAALIQVPAACMALVHQLSQQLNGVGRFRVTHSLKLQHPSCLTVHMLGSLVKLEVFHWGKRRMFC